MEIYFSRKTLVPIKTISIALLFIFCPFIVEVCFGFSFQTVPDSSDGTVLVGKNGIHGDIAIASVWDSTSFEDTLKDDEGIDKGVNSFSPLIPSIPPDYEKSTNYKYRDSDNVTATKATKKDKDGFTWGHKAALFFTWLIVAYECLIQRPS